MKIITMLILSVILPFAIQAQMKPKFYLGAIKSFRIQRGIPSPDTSLPFLKSQIHAPVIVNRIPNTGRIFKLPLDNMSCLSSTIMSNMPVISGIDFSRWKPVPIPNHLNGLPGIKSLITE